MRLRAALAALAALLAVGVQPAGSDTTSALPRGPGATVTPAELAQAVGGRGAAQSPERYAYLQELDSHLQAVAVSRLGAGGSESAQLTAQRQGVTVSPQGGVLVDVYANGDVARSAADLRALGMRVVAVSNRAPARMVEGFLPPDVLPQAAALGSTRAIVTALSATRTGSVLSQGDAAIRGPQARALGPNGTGVSVGIISDSINQEGGGVAASQMTGDLPVVQNLLDQIGGSDEGRAMAEIVYDEAPGISSIVFSSGTIGAAAAKASSIDALVSHGVKVIADDIGVLNEPFFQDGVVAQAVDRAKAAGVAYFTSAGNDARNSWEGVYTPSGGAEDFDPSGAVDLIQAIGPIPANFTVQFVLQWAEPWGGATTNLDVDFYNSSGGEPGTLLGTASGNNIVSGIPMEYAAVTAGGTPLTLGIRVRRVAGTATPRIKYIAFMNGPSLTMEHAAFTGAISPDAASANGAMTVAASHYATPTTPESFSSRGPVTHYFDAFGNTLAAPEVRQKPNLAAPDAVSTTLAPDFAPFYGTSAAAPAAAGIAALMISSNPSLSVDALYAIMTNPANALDCALPGNPDIDCGFGFLLADRAVEQARDKTPPVVTPAISPPAPDGADGWYRGPVSVSWSVSDTESPVVPQGCGTVTPGEGLSSLTCTATSVGGTTSVPLSLKRDATPPSPPVVTGIGATTYPVATLPKVSSITCASSDPTSGVVGCVITGYAAVGGPHELTATATNGAGLISTTTVNYAVERLPAISRLTLAKGLTLAKVVRAGVPFTLRVRAGSTRLVVKLVARVPKASGSGTVLITLASLTKKVSAGTVQVRVTLTAKAKRQLRGLSATTVKVTVSGKSANTMEATLRRSLVVRR